MTTNETQRWLQDLDGRVADEPAYVVQELRAFLEQNPFSATKKAAETEVPAALFWS